MTRLKVTNLLTALFCAFTLTGLLHAQSGGFGSPEVASPDSARASAGASAFADDASTAYHNPAGLTRVGTIEALVGLQLDVTHSQFDFDTINSNLNGSIDGESESFSVSGALYFALPVGDKLALGFSLNSPFQANLQEDPDWVGRYFRTDLNINTLQIGPSASYQILPWVHIGAGINGQFLSYEEELAINNTLDASNLDGKATFEGDAWSFGYQLGVLIEPWDGLRAGLTYKSEATFDLSSSVNFDRLGPSLSGSVSNARFDEDVVLPRSVNLGLYYELSAQLAVLADLAWSDWSAFDRNPTSLELSNATISRSWQDTYHIGIGFRYKLADFLIFQAGAAYDSSPVSENNRTADLPLDEQYRFAFGLEIDGILGFRIGASYVYILSGKGELKSDSNGPLSGTLSGDFGTNELHIISLTAGYRF